MAPLPLAGFEIAPARLVPRQPIVVIEPGGSELPRLGRRLLSQGHDVFAGVGAGLEEIAPP